MRLAVAALLLLSTTPVFALDAVTYSGTIGKHAIVVELTDPTAANVVGRYSYLDQGGDIPLDAVDTSEGIITLAEEAPCTDATCVENADYEIENPPIGAHWQLRLLDDGSLTGGWIPTGKGKSLDITLTEIGRRPLDPAIRPTPLELADSAFLAGIDRTENLSPDNAPYEFAKSRADLTQGPELTLDGSTYRYDIDPRSKFAFPTIVSLVDGSSPDLANAALASRHANISLNAFSCLSTVYASMGFRNGFGGGGGLGDFDSENIELIYLTPTLTSWTEAGSTYCGGAYPNNHFDTTIIDTRTGEPLALAKVFKDWIATTDYTTYQEPVDQTAALENPAGFGWSAGQTLIDYVEAHRERFDAQTEEECGMSDLVASNLDVRFEPGDIAVFTLSGLPHVIFACTEDLLAVKLSDIPELLAPTASDYFPALAR